MRTKRYLLLMVAGVAAWMVSPFISTGIAHAGQLADAIAAAPLGNAPGHIDPNAAPGFLGIPGAPAPNLMIGFLWAIFVGWIFSTIGAFGGVLAGVGHITVFGLADYGKSFRQTAPKLNKMITDSIRVSNQWLVGLSAAVGSFNYYRMGRLVLPLGVALALGSVLGSYLTPVLTAGKLSLKQYIGYFGLFVFIIGGFLFYETTPRGQSRRKRAKAAANAFEQSLAKSNPGKIAPEDSGVKVIDWSIKRIRFAFYGVEFSFKPVVPLIGGFFIAAVASFIGVGGGFLFVPFLTSVAGLPMFLVAGTSSLTVLVGMIVSIFTFMAIKGVVVYWPMIGIEMAGIFVGSMIGPRTSRYIPEIWLKRLFVLLAFYVGLRYASIGFLGHSIVPPF